MQILMLVSALLLVFSIAPLAGLIAALISYDTAASQTFLFMLLLMATLSGLSTLATNGQKLGITRSKLFVSAVILWLAMIAAAMPPFFVLEGHNLTVSFYEASSAVTTMGHSLHPVGETRWAMIVYRATIGWLGGFLTLVLAVYVLGRYNVGGTPSRDLRIVLRTAASGDYRIGKTILGIAIPYVGITLLGALALMATRINPSLALLTAMGAISTNGLVIFQSAGTIFNNIAAETVLMLLMMVGATSIIVLAAASKRQLNQLQDRSEILTTPVVAIVTFAVTGLCLVLLNADSWGDAYSYSRMFDIVSSLTTTALPHDPRIGIQLPIEFAIVLALVGGAAYSTSGGMKQFRLGLMLGHAANDVRRLVYPHRVTAKSHDIDRDRTLRLRAVWSTFFVTLLTLVALIILLAGQGYGLHSGISVAVGALTSSANLVGENLFNTSDGTASGIALILIGLGGIAGRLEILVFLAAFTRWR